jgi:hypothetical protein
MPVSKNVKYGEISRRISAMPLEKLGSTYQWEELVQRMCASADDELREIGIKEQEELKNHKR